MQTGRWLADHRPRSTEGEREVHGQVINATAAQTVPETLGRQILTLLSINFGRLKAVKPAEGPALLRDGDPQRPSRQEVRRRSATTKDRAHLVEAESASADNSNSSMKS
jgi:hypothetical protein